MKKRFKVALFLETSRHYGRELTRGIARYARMFGPWSFFWEERFYLEGQCQQDISYLKQWGVDGIIARDYEGAVELKQLGVPVISVRNLGLLEAAVQIQTQDDAIGQMAFDYFQGKGFREYGFCGFDNMPWSRRREASFRRGVEAAGMGYHRLNSPASARMVSMNEEHARLAEWVAGLPRPVAVLCCNDDRGYDLIEACVLADLKVPYDVAVLGIDNDTQVCELCHPPLSSVALGIEPAGYEAAAILHGMMQGKKPEEHTIFVRPASIVSRQSTDVLAIDDSMVTAALNYIQENSQWLVQSGDVARAAGCSRRNLDEKFMKIVGHTVFAEIQKVRVETIANMLLETDLTVAEIALRLGYNDADHIARFFKMEKKMTPQYYRKQRRP